MNRSNLRSFAVPGVLLLAIITFSIVTDSLYRYQLGTLAGIYAVGAIGLGLLLGGSGQISLGHAGFVGAAAWAVGVFTREQGWPWLLAAAIGIFIATIVGLILGYAALRLEGHYLALATLAFGLLFFEFMDTFLTAGIYGVPPIDVFGIELSSAKTLFGAVWVIVILCYLGSRSMLTSRFGRALAALRDDPLAASSTGVNLARTKITVFAISAALGGLSGALFAPYQASVTDTSFGFFLSFNLLMMVIIGGMRSPAGPIVGSLFLVIVPEFGRQWEEYRLLGYGVVLVAVIVLFPGGITSLGQRLRRRPESAPFAAAPVTHALETDEADDTQPVTATDEVEAQPALSASGIHKRFGGLEAVVDVDLTVYPGEIHALIGPNGAGKTTLFNCISGVDTPDAGTVTLGGEQMTGKPAHAFAKQGLMRTFQHARIFGGLTVLENVMVGSNSSMTVDPLRGMLRTPGARKEERLIAEQALGHLDSVGLAHLQNRKAGELTLAEERRLEIARCLAGNPSTLLFDEPAAGLGDAEATELGNLILRISRTEKIGVVLIEHHLEMALGLANRVTVLNFGRVIARGTPEEIRKNKTVVAAYIGTAA